jgi:hypothetical protein
MLTDILHKPLYLVLLVFWASEDICIFLHFIIVYICVRVYVSMCVCVCVCVHVCMCVRVLGTDWKMCEAF